MHHDDFNVHKNGFNSMHFGESGKVQCGRVSWNSSLSGIVVWVIPKEFTQFQDFFGVSNILKLNFCVKKAEVYFLIDFCGKKRNPGDVHDGFNRKIWILTPYKPTVEILWLLFMNA